MVQLFIATSNSTGIDTLIDDVKQKDSFTCVDCKTPVVAKKGSKKAHHFAHRNKSECKGETSAHQFGKRWLEQNLHGLTVRTTCRRCNKERQFVCSDKHSSKVECSFNGFRIDVGVFEGTTLVAALEVLHTSATGPDKMKGLSDIFFSEIHTDEIVKQMNGDQKKELHGSETCVVCLEKVRELEPQRGATEQQPARVMNICTCCKKEFQCTRNSSSELFCSPECRSAMREVYCECCDVKAYVDAMDDNVYRCDPCHLKRYYRKVSRRMSKGLGYSALMWEKQISQKHTQLRGLNFIEDAQDCQRAIRHNQEIVQRFIRKLTNTFIVYHSHKGNAWISLVYQSKKHTVQDYLSVICQGPKMIYPHQRLRTSMTWDVSGWDTAVVIVFIEYMMSPLRRDFVKDVKELLHTPGYSICYNLDMFSCQGCTDDVLSYTIQK